MLLGALEGRGGAWPSTSLLREVGAGRDSLLRLAKRGAVRLERRAEALPVRYSSGSGAELGSYAGDVERALAARGESWVWRVPTDGVGACAAAVARASASRGQVALVLAPEVADVERLAESFVGLLPAGLAVAACHGGMNVRLRAAVHGAFRRGEVDVLVGTRAAALLPGGDLGAIVVVDEPNGAHRAEPGHEGVPLHVREVSRQRARSEGAVAVLISPTPSLRLWDPVSGARRLPPRAPSRWPSARLVDVRGTGAHFSSALLDDCGEAVRSGGRVGVLVNRLGQAASLTCTRCGHVPLCPRCSLPLSPFGKDGAAYLLCRRCGRREGLPQRCSACGSDRVFGTGQAVEGVRDGLAEALSVEVGLLTAGTREAVGSPVVVGTARYLASEGWDLVAVPDADDLLFGGGPDPVEAGFRALYRAAEASRGRVVAQTRNPDHYALLAALRGDYEAFVEAHLPRRRPLGYPPQGHLAEVEATCSGGPRRALRAVESALREDLRGSELAWTGPMPATDAGGREALRLLLRGSGLAEVAGAAARLGRTLAKEGMRVRITVDPEEA
jgi:primosomal protein N' (replication factor Y)